MLPTPTPLAERFANVNLAGIRVRKACTEADLATVARLREIGFSRVARNGGSNGSATKWLDDLDRQPGVFSLIGCNTADEPIATMRVQDGRVSTLELASHVPLDDLLAPEDKPAAQFSRLSVVKGPESTNVMFALFKSAWRWCLAEQIPSIVIATPPWSKPIYDFMFFDDLGPEGHFSHEYAAGTLHVTMRLPAIRAENIWRTGVCPLCDQFIDISHPALDLNQTRGGLANGFAEASGTSDSAAYVNENRD